MPREQWRAPVAVRVKSVVTAAAGVTTAVVFFPVWYAVPVAVVVGAWGLGTGLLGGAVVVDEEAGLLVLRMGLVRRRVRLTEVTAVLVEEAKVSVARARGGEMSLYAWRKGPLDSLLRVPVVAGDIGHAIARAVALAQAAQDGEPAREDTPAAPGRTAARTRSRLATALLGCAGVAAIAGALLVRVHWDSPVMTTLGVIIALALGVSGLLYLLVALWILVTGRSPLAAFIS